MFARTSIELVPPLINLVCWWALVWRPVLVEVVVEDHGLILYGRLDGCCTGKAQFRIALQDGLDVTYNILRENNAPEAMIYGQTQH